MIRKFIKFYFLFIILLLIAESVIKSNTINIKNILLTNTWTCKYHSKNCDHLIQMESQYLKVFSKFFFIVIIVFMYDN